ncbi:IS200/IS605 family transposase [Escherichia coli]|uniref:IS200/IS605 family transposase n=1 Tax=Escherichia coli TaxID=562 RepID=UPI00141DB879|nr:IS200/IS605 family transposase [Escherichia coli]
MGNEKSLAHTRWNCKYHIVFAPKYRRQVFYREKRRAIGSILRKLCEWKSVRILEAECCADHIHMLVEIPPKMSVSGFMGYLKGKSSLMLYEQFGDLKFKYRNREFWCRGYYVDTVGIRLYGISEREKQSDALRAVWLFEIQIQEQGVLVQRVLRRYGG